MLLSFRAANHRSLKEEQQLLLVPAQDAPEGPDPVEPESLRVAGIFGSNASGKSNVLNALGFMQHMVRTSMADHEPDAGIERDPFTLDSRSLAEPSSYVVDLWTNGLRYTYGFAIDDVRVVEEWLYCYPLDGKQVVFERDADGYRFGPDLPDSVTQVEEITDDNTLFLTVAARSKQHVVRPVYDWFAQRLRFRSTDPGLWHGAQLLLRRLRSTDERWLPKLEELLRAADTGIERLELKRHRPTESEIAEVEERYADAPEVLRRHRIRTLDRVDLLFHHRSADSSVRPLGIRQQSQGTIALLNLGYQVISALRTGSLMVVDVLDANLHPLLSTKIIELFKDPETNPRRAQLLFSSHDAALLGWIRGRDVLGREEIWFTEKDQHGATQLFSLAEYEEEEGSDENPMLWYLTGRYGAVPEVVDSQFDAAVRDGGEDDNRARKHGSRETTFDRRRGSAHRDAS
ncbi:ATP-binding protein [Thermobifida halotolerans]|uniref:ATP-binding protein n=1 Tax=Thermobifida halotolerans TaxID=483545 RepID=A0AA97M3N1_9ACTN|nr:ATP-binding protein [Thermobifida halotolerans]UOE19328.1 ATP-binding protein [Thermobifida halotolerans]